IEGCRLARTDRNGICGFAAYSKNPGRWFPSLNVVIRKNVLEDTGGDAIKLWGCDGRWWSATWRTEHGREPMTMRRHLAVEFRQHAGSVQGGQRGEGHEGRRGRSG